METERRIRMDQLAHARMVEKKVDQRQRQAPKGHEAFLRALESSNAIVTFVKASSGQIITGKIKTSDKYTVSIAEQIEGTGRYNTRVLFKHDISEFCVSDSKAKFH